MKGERILTFILFIPLFIVIGILVLGPGIVALNGWSTPADKVMCGDEEMFVGDICIGEGGNERDYETVKQNQEKKRANAPFFLLGALGLFIIAIIFMWVAKKIEPSLE